MGRKGFVRTQAKTVQMGLSSEELATVGGVLADNARNKVGENTGKPHAFHPELELCASRIESGCFPFVTLVIQS